MAIAQKITELVALTTVDAADLLAIVDDPSGGVATKKITVANLNALDVQLAGAQTITGSKIFSNSLRITGILLDTSGDAGTGGQVLSSTVTGTDWIDPGAGAGTGNVSNTGVPLNNQLAIWTDATTIEGVTALTFDGSTLAVTGAITATSYDGVLAANLLDKAAAETISGPSWNFTGNVLQKTGGTFFISDTGGTDFVAMSHDGVDFNSIFTNTADWNITGITSIQAGAVDADFDAITATSYDGILAANLIDKTAAETISGGSWNFTGSTLQKTGGTFFITDAGNTDFVAMSHDGVDFNIVGTNTADINITGITAIQAGTVDADFDAITATSYGGITEANLVDKSAAEIITGTWQFNNGLFLLERTVADTDITNYGQVFVKNTTPEELWFASDDGVEHHVAGGSLAETFGKNKTIPQLVFNSTTLVNDTDLKIDVSNGRFYSVLMILDLDEIGSPSGDFKFDFTVPAGTTGTYVYTMQQSGQGGFTAQGTSLSWTTLQTGIPTGQANGVLVLQGTLTAGADGAVQLRWAQNVAQLSDTRVNAGSSLNLISG